MDLSPGSRWKSAADDTEVIVVRSPGGDVDLRCGGHVMVRHGEDSPEGEPRPPHDAGTQLGKRYKSDDLGLEVLCTKRGTGSLSVGDVPLLLMDAKPLPSSD
jgi:hypothetical protein